MCMEKSWKEFWGSVLVSPLPILGEVTDCHSLFFATAADRENHEGEQRDNDEQDASRSGSQHPPIDRIVGLHLRS